MVRADHRFLFLAGRARISFGPTSISIPRTTSAFNSTESTQTTCSKSEGLPGGLRRRAYTCGPGLGRLSHRPELRSRRAIRISKGRSELGRYRTRPESGLRPRIGEDLAMRLHQAAPCLPRPLRSFQV